MNKLLEYFTKLFKQPGDNAKEVVSNNKPDTKRERPEKPLGHISKYFESGRSGPGTISSGRGDPGGKSYGCHQLASKTGTLQAFLRRTRFAPEFKGLRPTSGPFDKKWKDIAKRYPKEFAEDQLLFIKKTHYDGVRGYANGLNIPNTQAINEALFSMGVQHGKAKGIIKRAKIDANDSEAEIINKLYDAREDYVQRIRLPAGTKRSVLNRYKKERKMVLDLVK